MDIILQHFPGLNQRQIDQFAMLGDLYRHWNAQINVVSRKDLENLYERHVLHSLAIAKIFQFIPETQILDVGTGGGFPGIPLAIFFPEVRFTLIDSIGKKIKVVNEVSQALKLANVSALQTRVEEMNEKFDFVVSRAVTTLPEFCVWTLPRLLINGKNEKPNGILYLKGGDIESEIRATSLKFKTYEISEIFTGEFFETKKLIHLWRC